MAGEKTTVHECVLLKTNFSLKLDFIPNPLQMSLVLKWRQGLAGKG